MGTDTAKIKFTAEAQQMLAEYDKIHSKEVRSELGMQRLIKATKEAGAAGSRMSAGTKQALDSTTAAADKYRQTVSQLRSMLESGKITEEKYAAARKVAQATYMATDETIRKRNQTMQEGKAVTERLATAEEKHAAEVKRLTALREAGAITEETYGRAITAVDAKLKDATKDTKALAEAEREASRLEQKATEITNANKTAKERYADNVKIAKKALDAGKISLESYNREIDRQKQMLDQADEGGKGFIGTLGKIGAVAAIATSGIQALIAEEQKLANLKKAAADENVSYGEVLARTVNNFSDDATVKKEQLDDKFAEIQERNAVRDRKSIARTAGEAFSAQGDLTNEETLKFVDTAYEYSPDDEATATTFATRTLDLAKATGIKDPKALAGFLGQTQKAARVGDINAMGQEGVAAMLGAHAVGATPEQSAELFATLNSLLVDVRGANSKTATIALSGQLMDEKLIKKAGLSKQFAGKGVMERIGMMQADPSLAKKFLDTEGVSFEGASKPFIQRFLTGEERAMAEYRSVQAAVPALDANAAKDFDKMIAEREALPQVHLSRKDRENSASTQAKKLKELKDRGAEGVAEDAFNATLENVDLPGPDKGFDIPVITGMTGGMIRVPGTESFVKAEAYMNQKVFRQDPATARANALKNIRGLTMTKGDEEYAKRQEENLRGQASGPAEIQRQAEQAVGPAQMQMRENAGADQQVELQRQQLEELKKLNKQNAERTLSQIPAAPGQPLLQGWNPALSGAPQGLA